MQVHLANAQNWQVANSDRVVKDFSKRTNLYPAEERIFAKYAHRIRGARVLDIGVGGGRTTRHLISRCQSYVGIDYAPKMIDACRKHFSDYDPAYFQIGDARDLSPYRTGDFDFVIFSYNGLDYVDHEGRKSALREICRVLRPRGFFFFSTHSLHAYPFSDPAVQTRNDHVVEDTLRQRGWYQLVDRRADVITYYIYPRQQLQQLSDSGFEAIKVLDMQGLPFNWKQPPVDWMIHFLCRRK